MRSTFCSSVSRLTRSLSTFLSAYFPHLYSTSCRAKTFLYHFWYANYVYNSYIRFYHFLSEIPLRLRNHLQEENMQRRQRLRHLLCAHLACQHLVELLQTIRRGEHNLWAQCGSVDSLRRQHLLCSSSHELAASSKYAFLTQGDHYFYRKIDWSTTLSTD